jgi:hypothetical protein
MEEIKQYIDEKFELIYKILKVCKKCYKGTYQTSGVAYFPPPLMCSSCGDIYCDNNPIKGDIYYDNYPIKQNHPISLAYAPAKSPTTASRQLAPTNSTDEEMLYGLND